MVKTLKELIRDEYNIEVADLKSFKRLWRIATTQNTFIVKPFISIEQITPLYKLSINMVKKGFKNFPLLHLSNSGLPYFQANGKYYIVMSYIDGESADFSQNEDLQKVIDVLADFHHSCAYYKKQLKLPYYNPIYYRLENRLFTFKRLFNTLHAKKIKTTLDAKIIRLGEAVIAYSTEALNLINKEEINGAYQEAYDNQFLAHRDVASHNFIVNKRGWLIDFDLAGIEPQFLDLWQLLNRIMLEVGWEIDQFQMVEGMYYQNKRLRDYERRIIRQLSLFPNDIIRESLGAYLHPQKFNQDNTVRILDNFINNYDAYQVFRKKISKV